MLKAGRQMRECLKLVDLVVELLDARIPSASRNPAFAELLRGKPTFLVMNKADLADPEASRRWTAWFSERGAAVCFLDAKQDADAVKLVEAWRRRAESERARRGVTRPLTRPLRIMIAGIPNVGKSTLVNRLVAARKAAVGPKPGVTRANQWVVLKGDVELLDTPGVLWPRIRSKTHELKLALTGAMKDEVAGVELVAEYLWDCLREQPDKTAWEMFDLDACPAGPDELLQAVGRRRGLLRARGEVDRARSAAALLKDYRAAKLGRFTLDAPD